MLKPIWRTAVPATLLLVAGMSLRAQSTGVSSVPSSPSRAAPGALPPGTAPLEERIAAARSVKVITSILGIELGSDVDEAHEKLDKYLAPGTRPKEEGKDDEEQERKEKEREALVKKPGGGEESERMEAKPKDGEEEEGYKGLWQLTGTDYTAIYITAGDKEHIDSITGFLRPEKQMMYDQIGDVTKAPVKDGSTVIWDVLRPEKPLFRVVATGKNSRASSIRLFVVQRKTGVIPDHGKAEDIPH